MRRLFVLALAACASTPPKTPVPPIDPETIELVESWPAGTTLDHANIPDAWQVWPAMFDRATKSIDLEEFYASSSPSGNDRLEPSIAALERAAARGVKVRLLLDDKFHETYPQIAERLRKAGVDAKTTKRFDANGGVLHAKFFLVDRTDAYLGSQNFDWRSLEHIQELGAHVHSPAIAQALGAVFDADWTESSVSTKPAKATLSFAGAPVRATFAFSPKADDASWDLPKLAAAIGNAKKEIRVQVLTYDAKSRDGSPFRTLDDALRAAAARGVHVKMIVSEWSRKHQTALTDLAKVPNLEIHVVAIPQLPGPEIPFARVVHAKYMVCDDQVSWVGTSNWEGDYFDKSRNVGLMLEGASTAKVLATFFDDGFTSSYATPF